ncbi:MAG: LuxR family transcriptional regulator [Alphaproteobacteria bacterium]|nr:LuxR family transcriptional regulator [Alphaproteobacteria bacterium]MDB5722064.1 LuxR family transcriptional regulator [Alphaproteobacteria bacterium]
MKPGEAPRRGVAALPEHQRICLRMVLEHKSSKEIAIELGISSHTVDQRLKGAMQILGVGSRVAAARLLAGHERLIPSSLVYQSPDIAAWERGAPGDPTRGDAGGTTHRRTVVREERVPFVASARSHQPWPADLPLRSKGGRINDLGTPQRLVWILVIMMGIALSTGMFLAGTNALADLALSAGRHPN